MTITKMFSLPIAYGALDQLTKQLIDSAKKKKQLTVLPTTMNEVVLAQQDTSLVKALRSFDLLVPDGMPLVWLLRMRGKMTARLYGPDIMLNVLAASQPTTLKHFFYGAEPAVLELLVDQIKQRFPQANIAGSYSPPFGNLSQQQRASITQLLKKSQANIIWVGLGGKKQVEWVQHWRETMPNSVFIAVGAAFDFIAGHKKQAPRWLQVLGLEWFFRLTQEPSRLWKRYVWQFPAACFLLIKEALKHE